MKALAVFYGDDAYALDTGIDNYIQGALPAEVRPFNFETLGPDTRAAAVILAAATLPFAADQRLTLVKNPAFALEKRPGGQLTEDQKAPTRSMASSSAWKPTPPPASFSRPWLKKPPGTTAANPSPIASTGLPETGSRPPAKAWTTRPMPSFSRPPAAGPPPSSSPS